MRLTLLHFFTFISIALFAQDYEPLNVPKRFQNSISTTDNNYYFYPIDTLMNADTTTYVQYVKMGNSTTIVSNGVTCPVWGDPNTVIAADTTWLGRFVHFNTVTNELIVENRIGEQLNFDFDLNLGDSAVFYQSATEEYYIKYDLMDEETILGEIDSVKTYLVSKYDPSGSSLPSNLNGFEIKLGKSLGLLSLIECNDFPNTEVGVELMGQLYPTIGTYNMTYDELYPWAPGDSLLVKGTAPMLVSYKLITISDRIESADSVWIYLNFEGDLTGFNIEYPDIIAYQKGDNFSAAPYNSMVNGNEIWNDSGMFCGTRKCHHFDYTAKYYCDAFNCFPDYDATGALLLSGTYFSGLGQTYRGSEIWGPFSSTATANLIYANVGGVICGTPEALTIEEKDLAMSISPNPVKNELVIQTSFEIQKINVLNGAGILELEIISQGFNQTLDVSELSTGVYFVIAESSDGKTVSSKFIHQ